MSHLFLTGLRAGRERGMIQIQLTFQVCTHERKKMEFQRISFHTVWHTQHCQGMRGGGRDVLLQWMVAHILHLFPDIGTFVCIFQSMSLAIPKKYLLQVKRYIGRIQKQEELQRKCSTVFCLVLQDENKVTHVCFAYAVLLGSCSTFTKN